MYDVDSLHVEIEKYLMHLSEILLYKRYRLVVEIMNDQQKIIVRLIFWDRGKVSVQGIRKHIHFLHNKKFIVLFIK